MSRVLELCYDLPEQQLAPGETLMTQGCTRVRMAVLKAGSVEVIKDGKSIINVSEPGSIFGEMAVILNTTHHATVRAVELSEVYIIEDPRAFLWERAEFNFELSALLARRLDQMDQQVAHQRELAANQEEVHQQAMSMLQDALSKVIHDQA